MKLRKKPLPIAGFDMTPMIDIVFLLVIFFMVSSTFITNRGIKVKLPKSITSQSEVNNKIIISIKENGDLYLNDQKVLQKKLGQLLKKEKLKSNQDLVIIKGDKQVPYSKMIEIMDLAKIAGLERISLATSQK